MTAADSVREISALFEQEISLSTALLNLMKSEQAALSANDISALETTILEKDKLVQQMAATEAAITSKLQPLGISLTPDGLESLLSLCDAEDRLTLTGQIDRMRKISTECYEQNLVNRKIIDASANNLNRFFSILQGQADNQAELYDLSGKSTRKAGPRIVERA